jgi:hypothetical protein
MNLTSALWVDQATLPCLAWAMSTRYVGPDIIEHECVRAFEPAQLQSIFNDSESAAVCEVSRCAAAGSIPSYSMHSFVFSPTDLGIPSERLRRYTQFTSNEIFANYDASRMDRHTCNRNVSNRLAMPHLLWHEPLV